MIDMWHFRKKKPAGIDEDLIDEIETLFDEIKEREITVSKMEEENEITISNLVLAYYVAKLERRL